jgi:hypothetical protein
MTLQERAEIIARAIISTAAVPYSVAATQHQQEKAIAAATPLALAQLKDYADSLNIKFD